MEPAEDLGARIGRIAALDQPLRRELYDALAERDDWLTRDEAAEAVGVPRSVAAFHLDKLAEAGILDVTFQRRSGRTGPGAGRPSKLYRRAGSEVSASVPERRYDLAGSLLAHAIDEAERTGAPVRQCLSARARAAGRAIGRDAAEAAERPAAADRRRDDVLDLLSRHGYEPTITEEGEIALVNCPFHRLAEAHRSLVCGMNLDFISGLLEGVGPDDGLDTRLDPAPGYCCVRITPD